MNRLATSSERQREKLGSSLRFDEKRTRGRVVKRSGPISFVDSRLRRNIVKSSITRIEVRSLPTLCMQSWPFPLVASGFRHLYRLHADTNNESKFFTRFGIMPFHVYFSFSACCRRTFHYRDTFGTQRSRRVRVQTEIKLSV